MAGLAEESRGVKLTCLGKPLCLKRRGFRIKTLPKAEHETAGIVVVGIAQIRPVVEIGVVVVGFEVERVLGVLLNIVFLHQSHWGDSTTDPCILFGPGLDTREKQVVSCISSRTLS